MGSFEDYYANLQKSVSGGTVAQKDDDFNKYYDSLKMDIGSIPDTRPKQAKVQEDSMDSIRSSQRQVQKSVGFTPKPNTQPLQPKKAPKKSFAEKVQDPSFARNIPFVGDLLKELDTVANNKVVNKIADFSRSFTGTGATGAGIAALTGGAEKLVAKVAPKLVGSIAGRITQKAASEAIVGAPLGVAQSLATGHDGKEALMGGVEGAAFGGALGGLGGSSGEIISKIKKTKLEDSFNKMFSTYEQASKNRNVLNVGEIDKGEQAIMDRLNLIDSQTNRNKTNPLQLNEPKSVTKARELQNRSVLEPNADVIQGKGNIHTFELPEGNYTKPTRLKVSGANDTLDYVMRKIKPEVESKLSVIHENTAEARAQLDDVASQIDNMKSAYQNEIDKTYEYLKKSRDIRGGVDQGFHIKDENGEVIDQIGRISHNPKWYQDYYAQHGKVPSNKALNDLAIKHVNEGYMSETGEMPAWAKENNYHDSLASLEQVKTQLSDSLDEINQKGIYDLAKQVAASQGHDLDTLFEKQGGTFAEIAKKAKREAAYGFPAEKVNIAKPKFNVTHENAVAMPETKVGRVNGARQDVTATVNGNKEVAATTTLKPRVAPIKGTVVKKDTVKQVSRVEVVGKSEGMKTKAAEMVTFKHKPDLVDTTRQKRSEKVIGESGFSRTLKESDKTPQGFKDKLDSKYTKLRNVDAVTQANKRISKSIDDAEAFVMGNSKHSPEKVATAGRLIDEFNKSGNYDKAVTIAEKVSKELTEAGQTVQAASIFNRLTPEGALIRAQRKVTKINEEATKLGKPVEITAKNAQDIKEAAEAIQVANVSKDRASDVIDIMDKLKAKQAITEAERTAVQDFIKDAQQYVKTKEKPIKERTAPIEMGEKRVKDKVISFLDAQEAAAKARMAARRGRANSLPLDEYADMAIIVAAKLAKGTIKTVDISAELIKDFGEGVKPHLAGVFEKAHDLIRNSAKRISKEVVSQAEKITENYIKKNEVHIKPEDVDFVRGLAKQVSELSGAARNNASQDLQAVLSSFERAGIGKKISAIQYISMLLNPLTQVKNIVGNELLFRLNRLSRTLQTPADMIYSGITGKDRTITIKSGPATWDNFFAPSRDYLSGLFQGAKAGWRGVNIEGLTTSYDISGQAFKSKLNPLTYLEKTLGATMKGFDYAAFNRAVQQRLRETAYLDAINKGIKGKAEQIAHVDKYMANLDDNIAEIAHEFGKKITLQDTTLLSNKLQGMRGGLNQLTTGSKDFGVGSLVLPFAKTPANLLMRAIDYSPAGFGKAIMQAGQILLKKETDLTRADVIQSVTDAILGTGMTGVGLWFASKGVLKGETSSDRDVRELEKLSGITQYQLNASAIQRMIGAMVNGNMKDIDAAAKIQDGDSLYQYEWAQPSSIPLALGANIFKERKDAKLNELKGQKSDSLVKQSIDVSTGAANTLFNTSVLQGLQQAFEFNYGEENKIKAFLTNIVKQAPSMFVPTMVGRVNQFQDSAVRETYSPDFMESVFNPSKAKISGQAQKLPQRVNTLGQPQTRENSIVDLFLNPATKTQYKPSPEAKEVMDLMSETGDERLAPRAVPKYITGKDPLTKQDKKIMLTGKQLVEYQTIVGTETLRLLGTMPNNLSTEKKVKKVLDILSKAGEKGRKEMRKSLNLR